MLELKIRCSVNQKVIEQQKQDWRTNIVILPLISKVIFIINHIIYEIEGKSQYFVKYSLVPGILLRTRWKVAYNIKQIAVLMHVINDGTFFNHVNF